MRENLEFALKLTTGIEGGYSDDPRDPGNWTGGKVGVGILNGTNHGISAAAYPKLDIKGLTLEQAKAIYVRDYWEPTGCDALPYPVDCLSFDRAVLYGVSDAVAWASAANSWDDLLFSSLQHMVDHWNPTYAKGWINRILKLWRLFDGREEKKESGK